MAEGTAEGVQPFLSLPPSICSGKREQLPLTEALNQFAHSGARWECLPAVGLLEALQVRERVCFKLVCGGKIGGGMWSQIQSCEVEGAGSPLFCINFSCPKCVSHPVQGKVSAG